MHLGFRLAIAVSGLVFCWVVVARVAPVYWRTFVVEDSTDEGVAEVSIRDASGNVVQSVRLVNDSSILIGRAASSDVVISESGTSMIHASISVQDGRVLLMDEDSTNGTLINNKVIEPNAPVALIDGDTVRIGATVLHIDFHTES